MRAIASIPPPGCVAPAPAWLAWILCLLLGQGMGLQAAVSESVAQRLRQVIDIPSTEFNGRLGSSHVEEWHSDHDVPDPASVVADLRGQLQGRPQDAPILFRISRLQALEGNPESRTTLARAIESARSWVEREPGRPGPVVSLAEALHANGDSEEASRLLKPWTGEGAAEPAALALRARITLDAVLRDWARTPEALGVLGKPSSEEAFQASENAMRQALADLDRAVAAQPADVWPLLHRARVRCFQAALAANRNPPANPTRQRAISTALMFPNAAAADLRAALRLRPDDPRLLAGVVAHECSEFFAEAWEGAGGEGVAGVLRRLPEERQSVVRDALARLDRLADAPEPRKAAMAIEHAMLLRILMGRSPTEFAGEAARALRLDPRRAQCFEVQVISIVASREPDYARLESLFRERVELYPQVRFRHALAKAQMRRGNAGLALATIREALQRHPGNAALHAAEFALLLKTDGFSSLPGQVDYLRQLDERIKKVENPADRLSLWHSFQTTVVVGIALEGQIGSARDRLRRFLSERPDDPYLLAVDAVFREIPRE